MLDVVDTVVAQESHASNVSSGAYKEDTNIQHNTQHHHHTIHSQHTTLPHHTRHCTSYHQQFKHNRVNSCLSFVLTKRMFDREGGKREDFEARAREKLRLGQGTDSTS